MKTIGTYKVVKGDTLFGIAKKFGMTVADLQGLNGLKSNNLSVGQTLKVRVEQTAAPTQPSAGGTTGKPPVTTPATPPAATTYTVAKGDTLFAIGRKFGVSADEIIRLNNLTSTALRVGQVLRIPGKTPATPTPVTPTPTVPQTPVDPRPPVVDPNPPVVVTPPAGDYLAARRQFSWVARPEAGFQRFELTVPLLNGATAVARMRDNVSYSAFMKYPEGIVYGGQSTLHVPLEKIESVGLNRQQAAALEYVSSHEGKYDAINSYDSGIFSYGFIQFVGAAEHGASLNRVLAAMKANAPARFARVFQQVGIDSANGVTTVLDDNGFRRSGNDAWLYIQKNISLYGAFIQAGFDADLVLEQLRAANDLYVQPALNFRLSLNINGIQINIPRLRDILSSEALITAVIAIAINRGNGAMSRIVADALVAVAAPLRLHTAEALRQIDERQVCQTIADTTTDARTRDRAMGVLNSGLSFGKA